MKHKRAEEIFADYEKALGRLKQSLGEDPKISSTIIDGTIQRFEFTFELAWKLMKAILAFNGISAASPRDAIKESFAAGYIEDGDGWIEMLLDRNKTSHLYDEKQALAIYEKIVKQHFSLLEKFRKNAPSLVQ